MHASMTLTVLAAIMRALANQTLQPASAQAKFKRYSNVGHACPYWLYAAVHYHHRNTWAAGEMKLLALPPISAARRADGSLLSSSQDFTAHSDHSQWSRLAWRSTCISKFDI